MNLEENKQIEYETIDANPAYIIDFINGENLNGINSYLFNPHIRNDALKNLNMNPISQDREQVRKYVYSPKSSERELRNLSTHFYSTQLPYKRLIEYFANILTLDWFPTPMGKLEKPNKKQYMKSYNKMFDWFDKFNHKDDFHRCMIEVMLNDVYYTYVREDDDTLTLQTMPRDYCKITKDSKYGYLYAFDLTYFNQSGVNINNFDPIFKKYYADLLNLNSKQNYKSKYGIREELTKNGRYAYWVDIPAGKGWVFKFHEFTATALPPLLGLFLDAIDMDDYKKLKKSKSELEASQIIMGTIPLKTESKGGSKNNDFAISATKVGAFNKITQNLLPEGYHFRSTPLTDLKAFQFETSPAKDDIVGSFLANYYKNAGVEQALFSSDKSNTVASIEGGQKIDVSFVESMYLQFERFCQYFIDKIATSPYKFNIHFEGSIFDIDARQKKYQDGLINGIILPQVCTPYGVNLREYTNSMEMMDIIGFSDKLKPIKTSSTLSKEEVGGRPQKDVSDLGNSGEKTRDAGSNKDKGGEV
jgi:hypothetical protein